MANKTRKIIFNPTRMKRCQKLKKYTNEKLCNELFLSVDTFNKNMTDGTIMPDILETICRKLDTDPGYITGEANDHVKDFSNIYPGYDFSEYIEELQKNNRIDPDGYIIGYYADFIPSNTVDLQFTEFLKIISKTPVFSAEKEIFSFTRLADNGYIEKHFNGLKHAALIAISEYIDIHEQ